MDTAQVLGSIQARVSFPTAVGVEFPDTGTGLIECSFTPATQIAIGGRPSDAIDTAIVLSFVDADPSGMDVVDNPMATCAFTLVPGSPTPTADQFVIDLEDYSNTSAQTFQPAPTFAVTLE